MRQKVLSKSTFLTICMLVFTASASAATPTILPIPQQLEFTDTHFQLTEKTVIALPRDPSGHDQFLARFLTAEISDRFALAVKTENLSKLPTGKNIILAGTIENPLIKDYCKKNKIEIDTEKLRPEGYLLHVTDNTVLITGNDNTGAFYGLQSLRQLMQKDKDSVNIAGAKINDWPYKPFRGLRVFVPGRENLTFFKRFIRNFMAQYKYNKLILEVNAVMRLDRHPELNAGAIEFAKELNYSRRGRPQGLHNVIQDSAHHDAGDGGILEKHELADIVRFAKQHHIEVIPEIPSLTHSYYLLTRHKELADIPNAPWPDAYDPTNPKVYELLFDVMDEYIEVIKPKIVHIGHDEWRIPIEQCNSKDKDRSELFVNDVNKIYNYLNAKDIKTAMWADHLLEPVRGKGLRWGSSSIFPGPLPTEQQARSDPNAYVYRLAGAVPEKMVRKSIPKDILMFNWSWNDNEDIWRKGEINDNLLKDMGFNQVYGNFRANITNWPQRSANETIIGGAASSWAASTEFNFGKDHMINFLGCANLLWSTHWPEQKHMLRIVKNIMPQVHSSLSEKTLPSQNNNPIKPLDISNYLNLPRQDKLMDRDLKTLRTGKITLGSKVFEIAAPTKRGGNCAVIVGSIGQKKNPFSQRAGVAKINADVSSLLFLHTCLREAANQEADSMIYNFAGTTDLLGWYEITYEDGLTETVPIRYGVNILEWDGTSNNYCYAAEPVNCAKDGEKPLTFYAFEWPNPRLGKKIKHVSLNGSRGFKGPDGQTIKNNGVLLLAVSAVEKRPNPDAPPPKMPR